MNPFKQIEPYKGNADHLAQRINESIDNQKALLDIVELFTGSALLSALNLFANQNQKDGND